MLEILKNDSTKTRQAAGGPFSAGESSLSQASRDALSLAKGIRQQARKNMDHWSSIVEILRSHVDSALGSMDSNQHTLNVASNAVPKPSPSHHYLRSKTQARLPKVTENGNDNSKPVASLSERIESQLKKNEQLLENGAIIDKEARDVLSMAQKPHHLPW